MIHQTSYIKHHTSDYFIPRFRPPTSDISPQPSALSPPLVLLYSSFGAPLGNIERERLETDGDIITENVKR